MKNNQGGLKNSQILNKIDPDQVRFQEILEYIGANTLLSSHYLQAAVQQTSKRNKDICSFHLFKGYNVLNT